MVDKPPPPESLPGVIKDRKPKGVEGQSAIERISRKQSPIKQGEDSSEKEKKK